MSLPQVTQPVTRELGFKSLHAAFVAVVLPMISGVPGTWCASGLPRKAVERILDDYELSLEQTAGMCALRWIRLIPQANQAAIATCLALRITWGHLL